MNSNRQRVFLHLITLLFTGLLFTISPLMAADAEQGQVLYRNNCSQCHGIEGTGEGINAPHLEVAPRNHTDYDEMIARTDEELFKAISEGGQSVNKSVLMPNWGKTLSVREIEDLVAYLRVLCCSEH